MSGEAAAEAGALREGIAVVTGAGAGLGRALALALLRRGVRVAGLGRRAETLEETGRLAGEGFLPVVADVADAGEVRAAFERLDREDRPVTVLVNNAAIHERFDFLEAGPEDFMRAVAVNLGGVVNCSHAALGRMSRTGLGRIVNVATFADLGPLPGSSAYSVSKGAARIFTRALLADIADRFPGIVVTDWVPGALATPMGLPDGLAPEVSAEWGAELALMHERSLNGAVFDRDAEMLPPRSRKQRLKDLLLLRPRPVARRLGEAPPAP